MQKLKLNYHITEACNFHCRFCFAKYEHKKLCPALQLQAVSKIAECGLFDSINFAGGEPLLDSNIEELIEYAKFKGLSVSLITNGFLLSDELIESIIPNLNMIGISVHSLNDEIKVKIGSCTNKQKFLTNERLIQICKKIHEVNPDCQIKLNTVVCSENFEEKLSDLFLSGELSLDKWKFLKCQSFDGNERICITESQFKRFISINNQESKVKKVFESNMKQSYIMMNPNGEIIKPENNSYKVLGSVLMDDIQSMVDGLDLDIAEYNKRYL